MHRFEHGRESIVTARDEFVLQGFTFNLRAEQCVAIECPPGCTLKVLSGKAWITMERDLRDVIAERLETVSLRAGVRTHVSALRSDATLMITAPVSLHNAAFVVRKNDHEPVVQVTAGLSRASRLLSSATDRIVALCRRLLVPSPHQVSDPGC